MQEKKQRETERTYGERIDFTKAKMEEGFWHVKLGNH